MRMPKRASEAVGTRAAEGTAARREATCVGDGFGRSRGKRERARVRWRIAVSRGFVVARAGPFERAGAALLRGAIF